MRFVEGSGWNRTTVYDIRGLQSRALLLDDIPVVLLSESSDGCARRMNCRQDHLVIGYGLAVIRQLR